MNSRLSETMRAATSPGEGPQKTYVPHMLQQQRPIYK